MTIFSHPNGRKRGFSVLELTVSLGIIAVMAAVVIVSLNRNRTDKIAEAEARKIVTGLKSAQNAALNGKIATGAAHYPCDYHFEVNGGTKIFRVYYQFKNSPTDDCADPAGSSNLFIGGLDAGVTTAPAGVVTADYTIPFGVISTSGSFIQVSIGGTTYNVCVQQNGEIYETKGNC